MKIWQARPSLRKKNEKRPKMDLSLDESVVSSTKEFVGDAMDEAVENLEHCGLGAKDKKNCCCCVRTNQE